LIPKPLPSMGQGFNVAVAEFVMVDANDETRTSDVSSQFSDGLFETIENGVKALPPSLAFDLRGPKDMDPVIDDISAARVANDINATVLIYGQVRAIAGGKYTVEPHFYISDRATFNYGSEITGPDNLGTPITDLTLSQNGKFNFNEDLDARIRALRGIIRGLGLFYVDDYKSAEEEFRAAINVPNWDP
jgi:hypothetical protein